MKKKSMKMIIRTERMSKEMMKMRGKFNRRQTKMMEMDMIMTTIMMMTLIE